MIILQKNKLVLWVAYIICQKKGALSNSFVGFQVIRKRYTIYTLENTLQEIKERFGEV